MYSFGTPVISHESPSRVLCLCNTIWTFVVYVKKFLILIPRKFSVQYIVTCCDKQIYINFVFFFLLSTKYQIIFLFRILFRTLNHQYDYTFDWTMLKHKAAASAAVGGIQAPVAPPGPGPR